MEFRPVIPFEPVRTDKIPEGPGWVAQVKWDGVRVLTYYDGQEVRLFNRRLNERTLQYAEIAEIGRYCKAESVILDGEIIALEAGKPSFHSIMRRDGVRQTGKLERARQEVPVIYMVFDVLYYNGEWINGLMLEQRQEIINNIIIPHDDIQVVENFNDGEALYEVISAQGMEGIVCKDLTSKYAFKVKDGRWRKVKNYRDLVAVVGGVTLRGNLVNALLLGLYDAEGKLWYIGHAGTGKLSSAEWRALTARFQPLVLNKRPFANKPERIKSAVWVDPVITVKIKFMEWTGGGTLRQPSIQSVVDLPPGECIFK